MGVRQQCSSQIGEPIRPETEADACDTQCPFRATRPIEHRGSHSPASLHDESRVYGVAAFFGLAESAAERNFAVAVSPAIGEIRVSLEVRLHIVVRQKSEQGKPGARNAERETYALAEHEGADRECSLFAE